MVGRSEGGRQKSVMGSFVRLDEFLHLLAMVNIFGNYFDYVSNSQQPAKPHINSQKPWPTQLSKRAPIKMPHHAKGRARMTNSALNKIRCEERRRKKLEEEQKKPKEEAAAPLALLVKERKLKPVDVLDPNFNWSKHHW